jgi:hypothetical protein
MDYIIDFKSFSNNRISDIDVILERYISGVYTDKEFEYNITMLTESLGKEELVNKVLKGVKWLKENSKKLGDKAIKVISNILNVSKKILDPSTYKIVVLLIIMLLPSIGLTNNEFTDNLYKEADVNKGDNIEMVIKNELSNSDVSDKVANFVDNFTSGSYHGIDSKVSKDAKKLSKKLKKGGFYEPPGALPIENQIDRLYKKLHTGKYILSKGEGKQPSNYAASTEASHIAKVGILNTIIETVKKSNLDEDVKNEIVSALSKSGITLKNGQELLSVYNDSGDKSDVIKIYAYRYDQIKDSIKDVLKHNGVDVDSGVIDDLVNNIITTNFEL